MLNMMADESLQAAFEEQQQRLAKERGEAVSGLDSTASPSCKQQNDDSVFPPAPEPVASNKSGGDVATGDIAAGDVDVTASAAEPEAEPPVDPVKAARARRLAARKAREAKSAAKGRVWARSESESSLIDESESQTSSPSRSPSRQRRLSASASMIAILTLCLLPTCWCLVPQGTQGIFGAF